MCAILLWSLAKLMAFPPAPAFVSGRHIVTNSSTTAALSKCIHNTTQCNFKLCWWTQLLKLDIIVPFVFSYCIKFCGLSDCFESFVQFELFDMPHKVLSHILKVLTYSIFTLNFYDPSVMHLKLLLYEKIRWQLREWRIFLLKYL